MKRSQKTRKLHAINTLWMLGKHWVCPEQVSPRFRESDAELELTPKRYVNVNGIYKPSKLGYSEAVSGICDKFFDGRDERGVRYDCHVFDRTQRDEITCWRSGRNRRQVHDTYQLAKAGVDDWKTQVDDWHIAQEYPFYGMTPSEIDDIIEGWDVDWDPNYDIDDDFDLNWEIETAYFEREEIERIDMMIESEREQDMIEWGFDSTQVVTIPDELYPDNEYAPLPDVTPDSPFTLI